MTRIQKLADVIHNKTCRSNHVDGCTYQYFTWRMKDIGNNRKLYFKKAKRILKTISFKQAVNLIKNL